MVNSACSRDNLKMVKYVLEVIRTIVKFALGVIRKMVKPTFLVIGKMVVCS